VPTPATLDALALLRRYQIVPVEPAASARR